MANDTEPLWEAKGRSAKEFFKSIAEESFEEQVKKIKIRARKFEWYFSTLAYIEWAIRFQTELLALT
jgi:hypothetical protein